MDFDVYYNERLQLYTSDSNPGLSTIFSQPYNAVVASLLTFIKQHYTLPPLRHNHIYSVLKGYIAQYNPLPHSSNQLLHKKVLHPHATGDLSNSQTENCKSFRPQQAT